MYETKIGLTALIATALLHSLSAMSASTPPVAAASSQSVANSVNVKVGYSTGVVTKINTKIGSVELNHKDIPGIMPAMIMEFYVKDRRMLKGLRVGDKVSFAVEAGHEVIVEIKKQ